MLTTVFTTLFRFSMIAGVIVLAVLLLRLCFKKAPRWLICAAWGLVALRLVLPFSIESRISLLPETSPIQTETVEVTFPEANEPQLPSTEPTAPAEPIPSPGFTYRVPVVSSGIPALDQTINPILQEQFRPTVAPTVEGEAVEPWQNLLEIASYVWLVGALLMVGYAVGSHLLLAARLADSVPYKGDQKIRQSRAVSSPFILGVLRPRIYLPFGIGEETAEAVIAHERTHMRRGDHLLKPMGFLLLGIYWFQPLLWVAYAMFCKDIEFACDEKVVKAMDLSGRRSYARALLDCGIGSGVRHRYVTACPLAFGEVSIKSRVKKVMSYKKPAFWIILTAAVALLITGALLLTSPLRENDPLPEESSGEVSSDVGNASGAGETSETSEPPSVIDNRISEDAALQRRKDRLYTVQFGVSDQPDSPLQLLTVCDEIPVYGYRIGPDVQIRMGRKTGSLAEMAKDSTALAKICTKASETNWEEGMVQFLQLRSAVYSSLKGVSSVSEVVAYIICVGVDSDQFQSLQEMALKQTVAAELGFRCDSTTRTKDDFRPVLIESEVDRKYLDNLPGSGYYLKNSSVELGQFQSLQMYGLQLTGWSYQTEEGTWESCTRIPDGEGLLRLRPDFVTDETAGLLYTDDITHPWGMQLLGIPTHYLEGDTVLLPDKVPKDREDRAYRYCGIISIGSRVMNYPGAESYSGKVILPESVRYLEDYAFAGSAITALQLSPALESIGSHAFDGCVGLQTLVIPGSVREIAPDAFEGLPENVTVEFEKSRVQLQFPETGSNRALREQAIAARTSYAVQMYIDGYSDQPYTRSPGDYVLLGDAKFNYVDLIGWKLPDGRLLKYNELLTDEILRAYREKDLHILPVMRGDAAMSVDGAVLNYSDPLQSLLNWFMNFYEKIQVNPDCMMLSEKSEASFAYWSDHPAFNIRKNGKSYRLAGGSADCTPYTIGRELLNEWAKQAILPDLAAYTITSVLHPDWFYFSEDGVMYILECEKPEKGYTVSDYTVRMTDEETFVLQLQMCSSSGESLERELEVKKYGPGLLVSGGSAFALLYQTDAVSDSITRQQIVGLLIGATDILQAENHPEAACYVIDGELSGSPDDYNPLHSIVQEADGESYYYTRLRPDFFTAQQREATVRKVFTETLAASHQLFAKQDQFT